MQQSVILIPFSVSTEQLLLLAEKHPESKANLLEIAQSFAKQLRACAMKSVGASGAVVKEKIEPGKLF